MTSMVGEAVVEVRGDVNRLKQDVSGAGREAGAGFTSGFKENLKGLAESLGVIYAGEKAIEFLKGSVEAAREANKVSAVTEARMKSTGDAAHVSASHVEELAKAYGMQTGIMPDVIQGGENMLLTFKNIRNEQGKNNAIFDQTTKTMLDLAASMAGSSGGQLDPKSAAIQLGKALNDPIKGLTSLSRVGVQFTDQQKTQIATLVAHNHLLGAQKIILGELNSEFGGTARAQATAASKMAVGWHMIQEDVGKLLIPVLDNLESTFANKVFPKVETFVGQMRDGKGAGGQFADTLRNVWNAGKDIAGVLGNVISALDGLPDWAKKALATGAVGAYVAHKVGLTSFIKPAATALGGTVASELKPVPVIVMNKGFGLPGSGGPGGIPTPTSEPSSPKGPGGIIAGGLSWAAEIAMVTALAKGSLDVTDSFLKWKSAGDNLTPTLSGIEKQLNASNVGKYASELHVNIPKLATDIQQFGDKGAYFTKVMDRLQGKPGLGSFLSGAAGTLIPGYTSGVEKADNATSDLLKITHAFLNVKGDAPVQTTKALEAQLAALGFLTPKIKKQLDDLSQTKVKPTIGADSTPLEGRYRVAKSELLELGHARPTPILDANNHPATMKVGAILNSLGIVDHTHVTASVDANTTQATTKIQAIRNTMDALINHPWSIFVGLTGPGAGKASGHASGVMSSQAGPAVVGEHGRELVYLPGGSRVLPNPQTERMLGGGGAVAMTITNWHTGEGYISGISDQRIAVQAGFDARMGANA